MRSAPASAGTRATFFGLMAAALCSAAIGSSPVAADDSGLPAVTLKQAWVAEGFKQPESVVLDPASGILYVSNINGNALEKDGNGFISRVGLDGKVLDLVWVDGLNAPKGLGIYKGRLYTADIDALVEVNLADKSVKRYPAPGSKFLNDVTIDAQGRVYVSDMMDDALYRLADGEFKLWVRDPKLASPNGVLAEKDRIVVGSWGPGMDPKTFATKAPGHLVAVSIADKKVSDLGEKPIGNIDGLEPDGNGNYFLTDWMAGTLYHVSPQGGVKQLLKLSQGTADLTFLPKQHLLIIPLMSEGKLAAYQVGR